MQFKACFNCKMVGQPCFEDKLQELNTDFAKICISPKPSGATMGKVPYKFRRNLSTNLGRISLPSIFKLLLQTASACNTALEKCQHSLKATFKRV